MVACLLQCLGGDRREPRIRRREESLVNLQLPAIDQPLAHDGVGEVAVRLLGEREIAELGRIAQVRERIFVAPRALDLPGIGEQQARLADEVQREVGEAEVLLEGRRVADPLPEPLSEHQARIREAQHVAEQVRAAGPVAPRGHCRRCAHRFFTSSGMA